MEAAGTSSVIYMTILGTEGEMRERPLNSGFMRGSMTKVKMTAANVGTIVKIVLRTSSTDDWYCNSLTVTPEGGTTTSFSVSHWISITSVPSVTVRRDVEYSLSWSTGANSTAGTIGAPEVTIFGSEGATRRVTLEGSFAPSAADNALFTANDVGNVTSIKLENHIEDDWQPTQFKVQKESFSEVAFDTSKAFISRDQPYTAFAHLNGANEMRLASGTATTYSIEVKTGNKQNGETADLQYVILMGDGGETEPLFLGKDFESESTKTVEVNGTQVGVLSSVKLLTSGMDGWYCESLKVTGNQGTALFMVEDWVSARKQMLHHLAVTAAVEYKIVVETGLDAEATTTAMPEIIIYGDRGSTSAIALADIANADAGSEKEFSVLAKDVGNVNEIRLSLENSDNWFCEKVLVSKGADPAATFMVQHWLSAPRNPEIRSVRSIEYTVKIITGSRDDADSSGQFVITLYGADGSTRAHELKTGFERQAEDTVVITATDVGVLHKVKLETIDTDGWFCESLSIQAPNSKAVDFSVAKWVQHPEIPEVYATKSVPYVVKFVTGNLDGAGSKGDFFMKLYGDNGETPRLDFVSSASGLLKQGDEKEVTLTANSVGKLEKLQLLTESSDNWMVESLSIQTPDDLLPIPFPAQTWIVHPGKGNVELFAGENYVVVVTTSAMPGSGTTGEVYITMHGKWMSTSKMLLKAGLEQGSTHAIQISNRDVGALTSIELFTDSSDGWYCESVKIQSGSGSAAQDFTFNVDRQLQSPILEAVEVRADSEYEFTITTGSSTQASSSASVTVQINGEQMTSKKLNLQSGFTRGECTVATLLTRDVGKVISITLETSDVDSLEIQRISLQVKDSVGHTQRYMFEGANTWLQSPEFPSQQMFAAVPFLLTAATRDTQNDPMYGDIYATIYGMVGQTGRMSMSAPFVKGKTQQFEYWQPQIGHAALINLQTFSSQAWLPEHITVLANRNQEGGGLVYICRSTGSVTASNGGLDAPVMSQYYLTPSHSIGKTSAATGTISTKKDTTPGGCMQACSLESKCKSAVFESEKNSCQLFSVDRRVGFDLVWTKDHDYYEKLSTLKYIGVTTTPTVSPTSAPTNTTTPAPTAAPTNATTPAPTAAPTKAKTPAPTAAPTNATSVLDSADQLSEVNDDELDMSTDLTEVRLLST